MFKGSYDLIKAIIEKVQLPADLKMLLIGIANYWSKDNPNPFPEYTTLVVEAGIPKRTLPRKLKALKDAGWLEWEHGRGRSNIYTLAVEKIAALSATMALPEMARPDLALPNEEVAPKLGTQVAPKLGTLTNIEDPVVSTPMRAKDVEPVPQEAPIPHPLLPAFSPPPPQAPPGWDIRGSSGGWSAYGPHYKHLGPFPTRDEAAASAYKVAELPRKAAETFTPVAVPTPSPPPPVAPPPKPRPPRYVVKNHWRHPGSWIVVDRKLEELLSDEDRNVILFPSEAAAEARVTELEKAA